MTVRNPDLPSLFSSALVVVAVTDLNDNAPVFSSLVNRVNLSEATSGSDNTTVVTVSASDRDLAASGTISFRILSSVPTDAPVNIDVVTGRVSLIGPLDREVVSGYLILVQASDNGTVPQTATAYVIITVLDENDNAPRWDALLPTSLDVAENLPVDALLLTLFADDIDYQENATVHFRIAAGNEDSLFRLNETSGQLTLAGGLDREARAGYQLVLQAFNPSSTVLQQANFTLAITVLDLNDNAPALLPGQLLDITLAEDVAVGTLVSTIEAEDADIGANAVLEYVLVASTPSSGLSLFSLDMATGQLRINGSLDFEQETRFQLAVQVRDQGTPMLSSSVTVRINVTDVNDNAPRFSAASYGVFHVAENLPPNTLVGQVSATDADAGANAQLRFELVNGPDSGPFAINSTTGEIRLSLPLDYEFRQAFRFQVKVVDLGQPSLHDLASVLVNVTNVNDLAPTFLNTRLDFNLTESSPAGTFITTLGAVDPDGGSYLRFQVIGESDRVFSLDPVTGILTTSSTTGWDREAKVLLGGV